MSQLYGCSCECKVLYEVYWLLWSYLGLHCYQHYPTIPNLESSENLIAQWF